MRRTFLTLLLTGFGLLAAGLGCAEESVATTPFTLSDDPAAVLLRLTFSGGMSRTVESYTLYGDGRLEKVVTDPAYPTARSEVKLSREQIRELLSPGVRHGLAATDQAALADKMRSGYAYAPERTPGGPPMPPPPADASTAELEIKLASYGSPPRPVTNRLRLRGIDVAAKELPGVPELQEWQKLIEAVERLFTESGQK